MSGFNVNAAFQKMASGIESYGNKVNDSLNSLDENMTQQDMLSMQFQINQYNMLLEATSTISKSLTDEMKQIAQRSS